MLWNKPEQRPVPELADIHCHMLPGIDDGAADLRISLTMLQMAAGDGIREIIFTPHWRYDRHSASPETVRAMTAKMQEHVDEQGWPLKLYTGNELMYSSGAVSMLLKGEVLTLADSDHILVEFDPSDPRSRIRNGLYEIRAAGFVPVLAHVERYEELVTHPDSIDELIDMGVRIQVNAGSISGRFGGGAKRFTGRLLKERLVHYVASDAHDLRRRPPLLMECMRYVTRKCGDGYAAEVFYGNARRILHG